MESSYRTVGGEGADEFVERRSRFIGSIRPVRTEAQALDFIAEKKKQYWDATHNVTAYVLREGGLQRYSDDGEPQGTAGVPALQVLLKEGLTDCAVVVTRYFGGILLGGGGLVRAYSHGAKLAVDAGGVLEMRLCDRASLRCSYAEYGWAAPLIAGTGGVLDDTVYTDEVELRFHLPQACTAPFQAALTERSAGRLAIVVEKAEYYSFPADS